MKITGFIKKHTGELSVLLGTGLFVYNIFNFAYSDSTRGGGILGLPKLGGRELGNVAYYYEDETLFLITLGAILIICGIFIIRNRRSN